MRICCITLFLCAFVPLVAHAETVPASLNQIVSTNLAVDGEVDLYVFDGLAGQKVTVTAAFGEMRNAGRIRLLDSDGAVLAAPETQQSKYRQCGGYCRDVSYFTSSINGALLPWDDTYTVEVSHVGGRTGWYSIGISDPASTLGVLGSESMTGSFAVRGSTHAWEFSVSEGESFIRVFRGNAGLRKWRILDPSGVVRAFGDDDMIGFTAQSSGVHTLILESSGGSPKSASEIGPHSYILNAPVPASFDTEVAGSIADSQEVDMFSFEAGSGWSVSVNVSFGESPHRSHLRGGGRMRLLGPDGEIVLEPAVEQSKFLYYSGYYWNADRYTSRIDSLVINKSGTYTVQIYGNGSGGNYWLTVDEPANPSFDREWLEKYSPILHIFDDDFRPKEIASLLDESVLHRGVEGDVMRPGVSDLAGSDPVLGVEHAIDMIDASGGGSAVMPPVGRFDKYQTAVYGRSVMDTTESGKYSNLDNLIVDREYLILQYWFFYPYNNFVWRDLKGEDHAGNNHEGDWEMIQLIVDPLRDEVLHATYSWHWAGSSYKWDELEVSGGTHPHVYVGKGGHASWGSGGVRRFKGLIVSQGDITPTISETGSTLVCDSKTLSSDCEIYSILSIPSGDGNIRGDWNKFPGLWGEIGKMNGSSGPNSPRYIAYGGVSPIVRWEEPILWANDPTPTFWHVVANSPVNLSVYDSSGNRIGVLPDGSTEANIPGLYSFVTSDTGPEYVTILTDDVLTFRLDGTDTGTMDLYVTRSIAGSTTNISFDDVPLTSNFVGTITVGPDNPDNALEVDSDGNGVVDLNYLPGVAEPIIINSPDDSSPRPSAADGASGEAPSGGGGGRRSSLGRGGTINSFFSSLVQRVGSTPSRLTVTGYDSGNQNNVMLYHHPRGVISFMSEQAPKLSSPARRSFSEGGTELRRASGEAASRFGSLRGASLEESVVTLATLAKTLCTSLNIEPIDALPRNLSARGHPASPYIAHLELLGLSVLSDPIFDIDKELSKSQAGAIMREVIRRHSHLK